VAHTVDSSDDRRCCSPCVTRLAVPLALAACAVLAAACSSSRDAATASSRTTTTTSAPASTVPSTSPPTTAPPFYEVSTGSVAGLGTILVNGEGFTLYMFEPDRQSGKSTCFGECENLWPPVLLVDGVKAPVAGAGANASLLGTTVRTGGIEQITYNGWPLYLWHGDLQPGEATGQGRNDSGGLWYVLDPEGVPVTASP
jgi:predicted lipoprotein with Yx(FWY)xxD motif